MKLHCKFLGMTKEKCVSAAASKPTKQSTLQFQPKKPKKNPWSDEDSATQSSDDDDMEAQEVVAPRERVERKTKGECRLDDPTTVTHNRPAYLYL